MKKLFSACGQTIKFAIPMVGARVIATSTGLISMLLIAKLGHKELAAGALVSSLFMTSFVISWSMLFSIGVVAGRYYGAKKHSEAGRVLRQSWILGALIGIPLMIILWSITPILNILGQEKSLVLLVQQYFHVLAFCVLPNMWLMSFTQFVTAVSRPRAAVYVASVQFLFTIIPGYGLLFGKFGLPALGMVGMAYASVLANLAGILIALIYLRITPYYKPFQIFTLSKIRNFSYIKQLFKIGYPISIQIAGELTAFAFTTIMIGWLGEPSLAAQQIVMQLALVILMVPYGISQASAILIGHALGRDDKAATRTHGESGLLIGFIFITIIAVIYYVFPNALISLFSINVNDPAYAETVHIATLLLSIAAISQIFDAIRNIAIGALRGFHDTKIPMLIGLIASWGISIPAGYIMAFWFNWGAAGVRAGFLFGWIFGSILLIKRFYQKTAVEKISSTLKGKD